MKLIDFEAHFYIRDYLKYLQSRKELPKEEVYQGIHKLWYTDDFYQPRSIKQDDRLVNLGEARLKEMDDAGIDMQVISLSNPGIQLFEPSEGTAWSRKVNDELSRAVKKHPDRLIGLASVAPQSPKEAAAEIERAVTELGLKGVCIQSRAGNEYLDDKKYWVIFEKAEELDVPMYFHPIYASKATLKPYADYGSVFAGPTLGFQADLALHIMRLIYSGLFDRYPGLKIILGHMGEGLPYILFRIDFQWLKTERATWRPPLKKKPSDYIKENFTVTTSGMFFQPALICAYLALGADRIGLAVDYPYEDSQEAIRFLRQAPICDDDKEKIYHLNAERLFKL